MDNYRLTNYNLSSFEVFKSIFVSEYGLRHLQLANEQPQNKWGHRIIAIIELCPLIGLIATIIEAIVVKCILFMSQNNNHLSKIPFSQRKWIFIGSQRDCSGSVPVAKVQTIVAKLVSKKVAGITFNKDKVTGTIERGTCTSMALEFANQYFKLKKTYVQSAKFPEEEVLAKIAALEPQFATSSPEFMLQQAAFNTIEVQKGSDEIDFSKNKVQALINYQGFKIDHSSEEIDLDKYYYRLDLDVEFEREIEVLPEGTYFVRILKPSDNEKLEEHGHSLIFVKEHGLRLFYDSNYGLKNLSLEKMRSLLYDFKQMVYQFEITKMRFYRLQES
jgi:hypothetical protein